MSTPFPGLLTVTVHPDAGCTYVVSEGELDLSTSGRIEAEVRALLDSGCPVVVLDLRNLEFIDSSGVYELLRCRDEATARGSRLALQLEPGIVTRALEVCAVLEGFDVHSAP